MEVIAYVYVTTAHGMKMRVEKGGGDCEKIAVSNK